MASQQKTRRPTVRSGKPPAHLGPKQSSVSPEAARKIIEGRQLPAKVYNPKTRSSASPVPGGIILSATAPGSASGTVSGAENIAELARALKNDVDNIYAFVYENIDFLSTFGSQKGAWGTLIDGVGNSFDQSELMIELLREAGYTANFLYGELELTEAEVAAWLGTEPTDIWAASNLLGEGFIPNEVIWTGTEYKIRVSHCWVEVDIGGTDYQFDPSMKEYSIVSGINLETAMDYDRTDFMDNATDGATIDTDYVQDINRANIRDDLDTFTANLIDYIQTNNPAASVDEILGGKTIDPLSSQIRQTSLPYLRPSTTPTSWTDIPNAYKATLHVVYDDPNINETFYSKDIHGKRLTITFNGSLEAELRLDGTLIATSSAQSAFSWNSVLLEMVHPYATTNADQSFWMTIWADHPYLIAQSWGNGGAKMLQLHQEKLKQNRFDGAADSDEEVIGEAFSCIWHAWNAQNNRASDIANRLSNCKTMYHHQVGLFGHFDTVYEDLPGILWKTAALDNDWDNVKVNDNAMAMHGIAFEAAVLQQMAGVGGVSTTSIIDIANAAGDKIYDGSSSNWSADVKPNLTNYDSQVLTDVENWWINNGWRVAIPEDGAQPKDDWTGWAYYAISPYQGTLGIIAGSLKGGTGSEDVSIADFDDAAQSNNRDISNETIDGHQSSRSVDLVNGQFTGGTSDLTVGSGKFPYGLEFTRSYRSAHRLNNSRLGLGWSHNHQMSVTEYSDGLLTLASQSPIQGAAGIVELFVSVDLYKDLNKPMDKWVTVALANQWLIDNITENVARVTLAGESKDYVRLPDGSFARPPASASTLEDNGNGTFTLTTAQGVEYNFNSSGDISTIEYPAGPVVTYTYTSGKLTGVANNMGRALTLSYTGEELTSVSDGNGRSVVFDYDVDGNLETVTDVENEDTVYEYDNPGRLTKIFRPENPNDPIVTNVYDSLNRVKEQKDAYNNTTTFYLAGPRAEESDPAGKSRILFFNQNGSTIREIDKVGQEWLSEYDGLQRLVSQTAPEGNKSEYEYDDNHNVTKITAKAKSGSGLSDIVNTFTYNSTWNRVATATDARGKVTTFTYDGSTGNLLSIEYPTVNSQTPEVEFTYNGRGQVLTKTDPTGIVTQISYDTTTEKLETIVVDHGTGRLNLTTEFEHDSVGNVISITDPRGNETTHEYDDLRRLIKVTAPTPFEYETKFSYDKNSNRTKIERETGDMTTPWQTSQATYFIDDLLASVIDPGSNTTSFAYTNRRQLYTTTDAASRVVTRAYDDAGRILTITDPASNVKTTYTYTDNGKVETIEDANDNVTEFEYDGFDRLKKKIYPDDTFEQLDYDTYGRVTSKVTRASDSIDFDYDDLGRLIEKAPDNMPTITYEYDLANRIKKVITAVVSGNPASGEFEYFYDTAGRLIKEEYPDGKQVQYQLNEVGQVTRLTYPDSFYVERVFDELGRMSDIKLNGDTNSALEFEYDQLSRRTKLIYDNGVETDYDFQWDNDLDALIQTFNGSSVEFTYGFNSVHELTSQAVDDSAFMWHPTSGSTVSYGTANELNQYPTVGGNPYVYNDNGCLTDNGVWDFGYDTENQLVSADDGSTSASYIYDPMHRQAQKEVNSTKTRYIHAGIRMIAEYDGSGNFVKRYVHGPGLDEVLLEIDSSNDVTYLHHDRLGSIVSTTDDTGAVINTYAYSPWGEGGSMSGTTFGFQGQRYDSETGLYFMKSRHYDSKSGRFLQPDPIGYEDGLNLYQFAQNDPNRFSDPLGLEAQAYIGRNPVAKYGSHVSILISDGTNQFTISAGPDGFPLWSLMKVRQGDAAAADLNRILKTNDYVSLNLNGWNTLEFAAAALWLADQFKGTGVYDFSSTMIGYNSNAFVYSMLNMLGVDMSNIQSLPDNWGKVPGWKQDIPLKQFGIDSDLYINHNNGKLMNMNWGTNTESPTLYMGKDGRLYNTQWGTNNESPRTYTDSKGQEHNSDWGTNPWENKNPWGDHGAYGTKRT